MPYTVILHLPGEPSVIGEIDELPKPTDLIINLNSPRQKDGKDLHYLEPNVVQVIWPLHRVSLIEVLQGEEDDHIIGFVRE
jgi:hypothetical protein